VVSTNWTLAPSADATTVAGRKLNPKKHGGRERKVALSAGVRNGCGGDGCVA
jgi:hypothetical protein